MYKYYYHVFYLSLGVLLKEFYREVDKLLKGKDVPRVRVYSAHDISVFQFASILGISPSIGVPNYGALLSLELRRDTETGQYIVVVSNTVRYSSIGRQNLFPKRRGGTSAEELIALK